jgi:queuine tRNA-ribosyltransferase
MPVGTAGTVKALGPDDIAATDSRIILGNTYHLMLRPGHEVIQRLDGLHRFMAWPGPILIDSGGFQVFSLASLRELTDEGVSFRSHLDGSLHQLTPARAMEIQEALGADMMMCLDECPPYGAGREEVARAVDRTGRWAGACLQARRGDKALFGIVQGGVFDELRLRSVEQITALGLDGHALGGLSVGEPKAEMYRVMDLALPLLPEDKPRYLMGVGAPEDLVEGVVAGADLFDCVLPTRNARNGQALVPWGRINVRNAAHAEDERPLDEACGCYACRRFSRAYLRHLFLARELLVYRLLTIHNLTYIQGLMAGLRRAIETGELPSFREKFYRDRVVAASQDEAGEDSFAA